jgi:hypothetical protein
MRADGKEKGADGKEGKQGAGGKEGRRQTAQGSRQQGAIALL